MSPEHEAAITRIRSSAAALTAAVQAVPAGKEMQEPAPGEWSVPELLRALPDVEWQREGRHPERGPMSIEFLARWVAEHAEEHAAQIAKTTALLGWPLR